MDPNSGRLYESVDAARMAGVKAPLEITGTPEAVRQVSKAVKAAAKRRRKEQAASRRKNR